MQCVECGGTISGSYRRRNRRYCSNSCSKARAKRIYRESHPSVRAGESCVQCGALFTERIRPNRKYCSPKCVAEHEKHMRCKLNDRYDLPSGTVGTMSELSVALDLMRSGYEVFRAMSPSTSCDLAVLKNGRLLRIEVRTGSKNREAGRVYYSKSKKDHGRQDHFAIVHNGVIAYHPPLPTEQTP